MKDSDFVLYMLKNCQNDQFMVELWKFAPEHSFTMEDSNGDTAIHHLASKKHFVGILREVLTKFSKSRARLVSAMNSLKETPLQVAIKAKNTDAAILMLDEVKSNFSNGKTALQTCIEENYSELVEHILANFPMQRKIKDGMDRTSLHQAVIAGSSTILDFLIQSYKDDLTHQDHDKNTCLHLAIQNYDFKCAKTILDNLDEDTTIFDSQDSTKSTPLHLAIQKAQTGVIDEILSYVSLDGNLTNDDGQTVLHLAVALNQTETVQKLMEHEFLVSMMNSKDKEELTPLMVAIKNGRKNIVQQILKHDDKIQFDLKDKLQQNILQIALVSNFPGISRILLDLDDSRTILVNGQNGEGMTPLMWAISNKKIKFVNQIIDLPELDFNIKDVHGQNILHLAVKAQDLDAIKKILAKCVSGSCTSSKKDNDQRLPIHYCDLKDMESITKELIGHNIHCGQLQMNFVFDQIKKENDFIDSHLFGYLSNNWNSQDQSLIWLATHHSKETVLNNLLFQDKDPQGLKQTVKMAVKKQRSACLRIFCQRGFQLHKYLDECEIICYISSSKEDQFDIIRNILDPYYWPNRQKMTDAIRNQFTSYLNGNSGVIKSNLNFFTCLNDKKILNFASNMMSPGDLSAIGKEALGLAMNKRLLKSLEVLLDCPTIFMEDKFFQEMLRNSFSIEVDVKIVKKKFNLEADRSFDPVDGNPLPHKLMVLEKPQHLKYVLEQDPSLMKLKNESNENVLMFAMKNHKSMLETLLPFVKDEDFNCPNIYGQTAIHIFAKSKDLLGYFPSGSKINFDLKDQQGQSALAIAIECQNIEIVQLLIKHNASLEDLNSDGQNFVHLTVINKNYNLMYESIQDCGHENCMACKVDKDKKLPIDYCNSDGLEEMVSKLLCHSSNNLCGFFQMRHIFQNMMNENKFIAIPIFDYLCEIWRNSDLSLIWLATEYSRNIVLEKLLQKMIVDSLEWTVKMAILDHKSESLRTFVANGIKIQDCLNEEEIISYIKSTDKEHFDIIKAILEPFTWPNTQTITPLLRNQFETYLQYNAEIIAPNLTFVTLFDDEQLLDSAIKMISPQDLINVGEEALNLAMKNRLVGSISVLLDYQNIPMHEAYYDQMLKNSFSFEVDIKIVMRKHNLKEKSTIDPFDGNPLPHKLLELRKIPLLKHLIEQDPTLMKVKNMRSENILLFALKHHSGFVPDIVPYSNAEEFDNCDDNGQSTLHIFSQHENLVQYLHLIPIEKGIINLNRKDSNEDTPLAISIKSKTYPFSQLMMKRGASLKNLDKDGSTIFHLCSRNDNLEVAEMVPENKKDLMNIEDGLGNFPFHLAVERNHQRMLNYFLHQNQLDILTCNASGLNGLWMAMQKNPELVKQFKHEEMQEIFSEEVLKSLINSECGDRTLLFAAIEEKKSYPVIQHLLASWRDIINVDKPTMGKTVLFLAIEKGCPVYIIRDILQCYSCPIEMQSERSVCFTTLDFNGSVPIDVVLKSLKSNKNGQDIANLILGHNPECGRQQIVKFLKNQSNESIVSEMVYGTSYHLWNFFMKWTNSERANFLHVATEVQNLSVLQKIFSDNSQLGEEMVRKGLETSIQFAAEVPLLESLDFLLKRDKDRDKTFDKYIRSRVELRKPLLKRSAEGDCETIFIMTLDCVENQWLIDTFMKDGEENLFHCIMKGYKHSKKLYDILMNKAKKDGISYLKQKDMDGNLPLHIAASDPVSDDKLNIIADMLEKGAIPSTRNNNGVTFLQMSLNMPQKLQAHINKMGNEWFSKLITDTKLLKSFINLEDDAICSSIFEKLSKLPNTDVTRHPIDLLEHIWNYRKILPKTFNELLIWEAKHHKNNLDSIHKCCFEMLLDPEQATITYNEMEKRVEKPLNVSYYVVKSFSKFFVLLFVMKVLDFLTDVMLNVQYYTQESLYDESIPSQEECVEIYDNKKVACYFHSIWNKSLFVVAFIIFLFTYFCDFIFVMSDRKSRHFLSTMVGVCCWNNLCSKVKTSSMIKKLLAWCPYCISWFFVFILNPICISVYGFWMETFVEYWRKTNKKRPINDDVVSDEENVCSHCKGCQETDMKVSLCVFCGKNASDDVAEDIGSKREDLGRDSFYIKTISKIVTSAIENSLMPLIQLPLFFPKLLYLFSKESIDQSLKKYWNTPLTISGNITAAELFPHLAQSAQTSGTLAVTMISITTSLVSMATTLTLVYFSKPGRKNYTKKPARYLVYALSIIFQVIPKILAYLFFAFGVIGYNLPELIIPSLLLLPLISAMIRSIIYHCFRDFSSKYREHRSKRASALFGLSTIYTFNEHYFYSKNMDEGKAKGNQNDTINQTIILELHEIEANTPDSDSEDANPPEDIDVRNYGEDINPQKDKYTKQYNERWEWHLGYDICSLMENILYGVCGAHFIVDENFDVNYACCVIVFMHLFGLLIKAAYYLFLHPWEKQNPIHKKLNSLHQAMSCNLIFSSIAVLLIIGLLIVALVYGPPNMKIFIYCLFALVGLVFLIAIGVSYYLLCVYNIPVF